MPNVIHGVVRTDRMSGTDVAANLVSVKYMGANGNTATAIDNGCVVKLGGLMTGEREIFVGTTPAATDAIGKIALIATPEVMYDERKKNLEDFENEAGKVSRAYILHSNDIFSVTSDAITLCEGAAAGDIVELAADVKLNVVKSLTTGSTRVGTLIAIENAGRYVYYVIQVA